MNFLLQTPGIELKSDQQELIERRVYYALGRFDGHIQQLRVRVTDMNGPRGGIDIHCLIEAGLQSGDPVVVEVQDSDPVMAVARGAERLARRLRDQLSRRRDQRRRRAEGDQAA